MLACRVVHLASNVTTRRISLLRCFQRNINMKTMAKKMNEGGKGEENMYVCVGGEGAG